MSEPILYVETSEIREGKLEELKTAMNELVEFVETNEPGVIAYNVYLNEDGNQMTVVHVHSDSASLEFHMLVAGPLFPKFAAFIKLLRIDLFGRPSDHLVVQLRQKAQMLGSGTVLVHELHSVRSPLSSKAEETNLLDIIEIAERIEQLSALGNTQKRSERLPWLAKKLLTALRNGLALFFDHLLSEPLFAESIKKRVLVRPANLGNLLAVQSVAIQ